MDSVKSVGEEVERKELLVETEMGRVTMEKNMGILKTDLKWTPSIPLLAKYVKRMKLVSQSDISTPMSYRIVHNHQEPTKQSLTDE